MNGTYYLDLYGPYKGNAMGIYLCIQRNLDVCIFVDALKNLVRESCCSHTSWC